MLPGLTLVVMALGSPAASTAIAEEVELIPYETLERKTSLDYEAAKAYRPPERLSFRVEKAPTREGKHLVLRGVLENAGAEAEVVVFPNPAFFVELSGEGIERAPPSGPPSPPPAPPPPQTFVVPEASSILFEHRLFLGDYRFAAGAEAVLKWSFLYWNEPRPKGELRVKLKALE